MIDLDIAHLPSCFKFLDLHSPSELPVSYTDLACGHLVGAKDQLLGSTAAQGSRDPCLVSAPIRTGRKRNGARKVFDGQEHWAGHLHSV